MKQFRKVKHDRILDFILSAGVAVMAIFVWVLTAMIFWQAYTYEPKPARLTCVIEDLSYNLDGRVTQVKPDCLAYRVNAVENQFYYIGDGIKLVCFGYCKIKQ